ncbi:MAG TPA: YihY/virulence factor BrkB family protein [Fimbriimonadaceae bacterium]|jgi:membrane protein
MTVEMLRPIFAKAFKYWNEDQAPRYSAAITFYLMLALSPLLIFLVAASSLLLQNHELQTHLVETVTQSMGEAQGTLVGQIITSSHSRGVGYVATIVGLVVSISGASGLFLQLRLSVNSIWRVETKASGIKGFIGTKVVSILMVLIVGIVFLGWLAFDWWLRIVRHEIGPEAGFPIKTTLSFILSWAFWTPVYAAMLKWLPQRKLQWRDVWLGGIVTSLAYAVSKYLLSLYFTYSSVSVTYGTAGALIVILLWAYYSCQIFFYGVELSRAYAEAYGSLKGTLVAETALREELARDEEETSKVESRKSIVESR